MITTLFPHPQESVPVIYDVSRAVDLELENKSP